MRGILIFIGLLAVGSLKSQIYVKPGGEGNGSSWEQAMGNIREALLKDVAEVRVAIGSYRLDGELLVKNGQLLTGGWLPEADARVGDAAEKTILIAAERQRVVTVSGTMQGFTVTKGIVVEGKGGGIYITSTGKVENCIVKENTVSDYYPKVGDLLCDDGSFMTIEEVEAGNADRICGIVFWVNPDIHVPEYQRGWAMALNMGMQPWCELADEHIPVPAFATVKDAMTDTMGYAHARSIYEQGKEDFYPAVLLCKELSTSMRTWYVPAFRQLNVLFSELGRMKQVLEQLAPYTVQMSRRALVRFPEFRDGAYLSSSEKDSGEYNWSMSLNTESMVCGTTVWMDPVYVLPVTSF